MTDVLLNLQKLPAMCAARHPTDGTPILIKRGVAGYWRANPRLDVDRFNARAGVSAAQLEAMQIGSAFGWDVPGADPDHHWQTQNREADAIDFALMQAADARGRREIAATNAHCDVIQHTLMHGLRSQIASIVWC